MSRFHTLHTLVARFVCLAAVAAVVTSAGPATQAGPITADRLLWFKADAITGLSDGNEVTTWVDSHGGNDATGTSGTVPTYQSDVGSLLNGLPVVRYDGSGDILTTPSIAPGSDEATVFVVAKVTTKTSFGEFVDYGINSSGSWNLRQESSTGRLSFIHGVTNSGAGATGAFAPAGTTVDLEGQGFKVLAGSVTAADAWNIWENGDNKHTNTVAFTQAASNTVTLGNRGDDTAALNGDIAEVIVYSRALNSAERTITDNYLGAKWDRTLSDDRYEGDTGGNGDYDSGVFGIGRESDGAVLSGTFGQGLTIDELNGSLLSGEYVMAGHKSATNALTTNDLNGATQQRWERVWYVDKTETSGVDAKLTFDFSDGGLAFPTLSALQQFVLLYSETPAFAFTELGIAPVIVGDQVSFSVLNANLLDGYYTLGIASVPEPSTAALVMLAIAGLSFARRRRGRGARRS